MLAIIALRDRSMLRFAGSMILAAAMHVTALLMPAFVFGSRVDKRWAAIVGGPIFVVGYMYFWRERADKSIDMYIENALPAFLDFVLRSRFKFDDDELRFLEVLALIALAFVGLLYVSPPSTAVDRMGLYIIPIQLIVLVHRHIQTHLRLRQLEILTSCFTLNFALKKRRGTTSH